MGFMRKAAIISTGGIARAAIKPNSKKERVANAAEKALKVQKAEAKRASRSQRNAQRSAPVAVGPDHVCEMCGKAGHDRSYHVPGTHRPPVGPSRSAPVRATPSAAALINPMDQLSQLAKLRDSGAITEDEFAAKKAEILGRI